MRILNRETLESHQNLNKITYCYNHFWIHCITHPERERAKDTNEEPEMKEDNYEPEMKEENLKPITKVFQ